MPLLGTSPNMVAVGKSAISGTTNAAQLAVAKAGVSLYSVLNLGPRDDIGTSEVDGEYTPMQRLLSEALTEFEVEETNVEEVHSSLSVEWCPMSGPCAKIAFQEYTQREHARIQEDVASDCCPRSGSGGVLRRSDGAEDLKALYVMRYLLEMQCAKAAYREYMSRELARVQADSAGDGCPRSNAGGVVPAKPLSLMRSCLAAGSVGALASTGITAEYSTTLTPKCVRGVEACGRTQSLGDDGGTAAREVYSLSAELGGRDGSTGTSVLGD